MYLFSLLWFLQFRALETSYRYHNPETSTGCQTRWLNLTKWPNTQQDARNGNLLQPATNQNVENVCFVAELFESVVNPSSLQAVCVLSDIETIRLFMFWMDIIWSQLSRSESPWHKNYIPNNTALLPMKVTFISAHIYFWVKMHFRLRSKWVFTFGIHWFFVYRNKANPSVAMTTFVDELP